MRCEDYGETDGEAVLAEMRRSGVQPAAVDRRQRARPQRGLGRVGRGSEVACAMRVE